MNVCFVVVVVIIQELCISCLHVVRAKSFPMMCIYEDHDLDVPDGLQSEVQEMMHRARVKSSSSETDTDSSTDMTVIRHKSLRRIRHGSDRSYGEKICTWTM